MREISSELKEERQKEEEEYKGTKWDGMAGIEGRRYFEKY